MKTNLLISWIALAVCSAHAASSTIDPAHKDAYGANIGWINALADTANGAVIGQSYCSGYLYSANCGWISLGSGMPANGWQYSNTTSTDWGVNHDGTGALSGYAYGANIGWINFEQSQGVPQIDLMTGNLSGSIWSANCGWISLSNAQAYVRTQLLDAGPDVDEDGIPDAWEQRMVQNLTTLSGAGHDADLDGVSDVDESVADTNPKDILSFLKVVDFKQNSESNRLTWTVQPTRLYRIEQSSVLGTGASWSDCGMGQMAPASAVKDMTRYVADPGDPGCFYRIKAIVPLP
jgi:hypothetical protein